MHRVWIDRSMIISDVSKRLPHKQKQMLESFLDLLTEKHGRAVQFLDPAAPRV